MVFGRECFLFGKASRFFLSKTSGGGAGVSETRPRSLLYEPPDHFTSGQAFITPLTDSPFGLLFLPCLSKQGIRRRFRHPCPAAAGLMQGDGECNGATRPWRGWVFGGMWKVDKPPKACQPRYIPYSLPEKASGGGVGGVETSPCSLRRRDQRARQPVGLSVKGVTNS